MRPQVPPLPGSHGAAHASASAASAWQSRAAHAPASAAPLPGSHELPMCHRCTCKCRQCLAVTEPPMHLQVPPVPGSHEPPMYCQCTCKCLVCAASAWYSRAADVPPMRLQVPPLPGSHGAADATASAAPLPGSQEPPMHLRVQRLRLHCLAVTSCLCTCKGFVCVATAWQSRAADAPASAASAWQSRATADAPLM